MPDVVRTPYVEPPPYHRCSTPVWRDKRYGKHSVWQCGSCGQYWVKCNVFDDGPHGGLFATEWEKLRFILYPRIWWRIHKGKKADE